MSREIKFRVMDIDGNWHYYTLGDFVCHTPIPVQLNPEAWTQFTGLKDVNGVEIYESDIIDFGDLYGEVGVASYCRDSARFVCSLIESGRVVSIAEHLMFGDYHVSRKVIGNIYKNPELLK